MKGESITTVRPGPLTRIRHRFMVGLACAVLAIVSVACDTKSEPATSLLTSIRTGEKSNVRVLEEAATQRIPYATPTYETTKVSAAHSLHPKMEGMGIVRIFPEISFERTVYMASPDDGSERFFLVLQPGRVMVFDKTGSPSSVETYLDLRHLVSDHGNEEGLLGIAFHPAYKETGFFYVYYSAADPRRSVVSRFEVDGVNPNHGNPNSERILLEIRQPFSNHNGGQIEFGPDGYLYIGVGDGGGANDPHNNAQDTTTLLGTILRIDVDLTDSSDRYEVPVDNPFIDSGGSVRPEIWAYGLRNPWRFSFDPEKGDLWAGDVGQNRYEEIDLIERGGNYGWNITEGFHCFGQRNPCDHSDILPPVVAYGREGGCSVTGGYVYRGVMNPSIYGAYIYGDFCSGKIWALRYNGAEVTEHIQLVDSGIRISSFAEDQAGEVYVLSLSGGIYLLTPD